MARIFISLSGDGRGHATRVRALTEALRAEHEITLFTSDRAFAFLAPLYRGSAVRVRRIAGLRFGYTPGGGLDYWKTLVGGVRYLRRLRGLVTELQRAMEQERPDLMLCDFEPALPRAARRAGLQFVSVDHQHFLLTYDLGGLPWWLRWRAVYMGWVVRGYYSRPMATIVSSFYFPPLRPRCREVHQVGVLLRQGVREARPAPGEYLVAYVRRFAPESLLDALAATGREVRVYGLGERPDCERLRFRPVGEASFTEDLAGCAALVSTAGNQLVGEALYLGKPVFAVPEPRNYEQYINAHFLAQSGAGTWAEPGRIRVEALRDFLARLDEYRGRIDAGRMDGLPATLAVLRNYLPGSSGGRSGPGSAAETAVSESKVIVSSNETTLRVKNSR